MSFARNPKSPMTPRKAREIMNLDKTEKQFASLDMMKIRAAHLADASLTFHEELWLSKGKARQRLRQNMEKHPREFHAKERSAALFLNKFMPTRIETKDTTPGRGTTADELEKLNLSMEELKRLAFGNKQEEAEIVEPEASNGSEENS